MAYGQGPSTSTPGPYRNPNFGGNGKARTGKTTRTAAVDNDNFDGDAHIDMKGGTNQRPKMVTNPNFK